MMIYLTPLPLDLQAPQPGGVFISLPFNLGINQHNARWGLKSTWGLGHSLCGLPLESWTHHVTKPHWTPETQGSGHHCPHLQTDVLITVPVLWRPHNPRPNLWFKDWWGGGKMTRRVKRLQQKHQDLSLIFQDSCTKAERVGQCISIYNPRVGRQRRRIPGACWIYELKKIYDL